jgi:hypothetical protein
MPPPSRPLQDRADYVALNMSCPNSAADRDFFDELTRVDALLDRLALCDPRGAADPEAQADARRRRAARDRRDRRRAIRSSPASRSTCRSASPRTST